MKKHFILLTIVFLFSFVAISFAETIEISDIANVYQNYNSYQSNEIIGTVMAGESYRVLAKNKDELVGLRYKIKLQSSQEGWVSNIYCDLITAESSQEPNIPETVTSTKLNASESASPESSEISASDKKVQEDNNKEEIIGIAEQAERCELNIDNTQAKYNSKTKTLTIAGDEHMSFPGGYGDKTLIAFDLIDLFQALPEVKIIKYTIYKGIENRWGEKVGRRIKFSILAYRSSWGRMKAGLGWRIWEDTSYRGSALNSYNFKDYEDEANKILYNFSHP